MKPSSRHTVQHSAVLGGWFPVMAATAVIVLFTGGAGIGLWFLLGDVFSDASAVQRSAAARVGGSPYAEPVDRRKSAIESLEPVRLSGRLLSVASSTQLMKSSAAPAVDVTVPSVAKGGPLVLTASAASMFEPPMETARRTHEASELDSAGGIQITSGFAGSTPIRVEKISATHFSVALATPGFQDWFMFKVSGAAGKTVRIDIKPTVNMKHRWTTLNPVWTASDDLSNPVIYRAKNQAAEAPEADERAWNGAALPQQAWHWVSNCWMPNEETFSLVQQFDGPVVTLAMRVPYTADYNARVTAALASNPIARVEIAGQSKQGRPLYVVNVSDDANAHDRPCVVLYAGEHADEQDAMWVASGAIQFLLGPSPAAADLRHRFQFVVIPQLDPDASTAGVHSGVIISFMSDRETPESRAYANWFQKWVNTGHRLDVVIDLHNEQSGEMNAHLLCAWTEGLGERGRFGAALHDAVIEQAAHQGFKIETQISHRGWSPDRLGGWLSRRYGPISSLYEVNAQEGSRHLSLADMEQLGGLFLQSAATLLDGPCGVQVMNEVDTCRSERNARWAAAQSQVEPGSSAIAAEAIVSRGVGLPSATTVAKKSLPREVWIP